MVQLSLLNKQAPRDQSPRRFLVSFPTSLHRPRTTFDGVRRPTEQEWDKWTLMPQLPLWQAVSLFCEIEPSSLPVEGVWRIAPADSPASIFRDRFEIAIAHQGEGSLKCLGGRAGLHTEFVVQAGDFAGWWVGLGWLIPADLYERWDAQAPGGTSSAAAPAASAWPWGSHETELLRWLAAAAQKFWVNYDPTDPTTAVTSDEVVAWLRKQQTSDGRPISLRVAEIMAQILRPAELPTGPRKKS